MWTHAFDRFVEPARAKPQAWRILLGILLIIVIYALGIIELIVLITLLSDDATLLEGFQAIADGGSPTSTLVLLATFIGMFVGPLIAVNVLHNRGSLSLFGDGTKGDFIGAVLLAFGLLALSGLLLPSDFTPVRNTPTDVFLTFLVPALALLLLQTGAEELLFRGYLQQQLAARFRHPIIWMVVPSLLFGVLHVDPGSAGGNAIWVAAIATLFGLVAADLTRVTGSIGAAWGFHFANNTIGLLIVSIDGPLGGLSLWTTPFDASDTDVLPALLVQNALMTIIVWASIRLWLARRSRS